MAELAQGQRISAFLPANNPAERVAARRVLRQFEQLFPGCTVSTLNAPVYTGVWLNPATRMVEQDRIAIAFADLSFDSDADPALLDAVDDIRRTMFDAYRDAGSPQADVWVTVHAVKTSS